EIGFVEAQRFDEVGIVEEDRADVLADGAVDVEARLHENEIGTHALGRGRRHRRSDAERARFVAGGGDDTPMAAAYCDRLALEARIVSLLHRRIKSVHVDMDDLPGRSLVALHQDKLLIKAPAHEHPRISSEGTAGEV